LRRLRPPQHGALHRRPGYHGGRQQLRPHPRCRCLTRPASASALGAVRRCAGCHCFEPQCAERRFVDVGVGDGEGRCVCLACCRTVVTDTAGGALPAGPGDRLLRGPAGAARQGGRREGWGKQTRREEKEPSTNVAGSM
jgi:hypothetical protein